MSVYVKRLLLDVLKPRELSIIDLSKAICTATGVKEVDMIVSEVDSKTETLKVTIKGEQIAYPEISEIMEKYGVALRGIDELSVSQTGFFSG